jgi:hypothetical protein
VGQPQPGITHRTVYDNRSQLFDATPSTSGRSTPFSDRSTTNIEAFSSRTAEELESQNDERLDGLLGKVKQLKDVGGEEPVPTKLS